MHFLTRQTLLFNKMTRGIKCGTLQRPQGPGQPNRTINGFAHHTARRRKHCRNHFRFLRAPEYDKRENNRGTVLAPGSCGTVPMTGKWVSSMHAFLSSFSCACECMPINICVMISRPLSPAPAECAEALERKAQQRAKDTKSRFIDELLSPTVALRSAR